MRRAAGLVALALALLAGCGGGGGGPRPLALDGRPRYPNAEGVVEAVTVKSIRLAGGRTYKVSPKLQSFSTTTLETLPLLQRKGQYVQVGVHGDTVVWIANVGAILPVAPPAVYYQGTLIRADAQGRLVFRDGTVLQTTPGVRSPVPNGLVRAEIDPSSHRVRSVAQP